jgi:hypothetical protein
MSAPSRKSGYNAWAFILWLFAGYFFLGFPAAFLVGLNWLPSDETVTAFAPLIWAMEQTGPLGEAWADLIMECHSFGQSLKPQ